MDRWELLEVVGGGFGRDVTLGHGEHFITDHELFDSGRAQQGGEEVCVKMEASRTGILRR